MGLTGIWCRKPLSFKDVAFLDRHACAGYYSDIKIISSVLSNFTQTISLFCLKLSINILLILHSFICLIYLLFIFFQHIWFWVYTHNTCMQGSIIGCSGCIGQQPKQYIVLVATCIYYICELRSRFDFFFFLNQEYWKENYN